MSPETSRRGSPRRWKQPGARATPERPLAWIALEANRVLHIHEMTVRYWPGGAEPVTVTRAHPHGASLEWLAEN